MSKNIHCMKTMRECLGTMVPGSWRMLAGVFLLNVIFFPVFLSSCLFFINVPVQEWTFPFAIIAAGGFSCLLAGRDYRKMGISIACGVLCLTVILLLCTHTYDFSWDGNTYHKSIIALLKDGWNPLQETFYSYAERFPFLSSAKETWFDAYPKGTELWAATVYAFLGNIEAGKAFNFLSGAALLLILWEILMETARLKRGQAFLCAAVFSINPILSIQGLTYYNDAFLWEMLLLFIASLLYLTLFEDGRYRQIFCYSVFVSINIGFNTKFSAVIFFGMIGLSFFGFWMVEELRAADFRTACGKVSGRFFLLACSVISGLELTGATSYIINTVRHHNPFYTMIGEGSTELITLHMPVSMKGLPHAVRFVASLFSKVSNDTAVEAIQWKLPFQFYSEEFLYAQMEDTRVAGWGIFFSAIFLLSLFCIVWHFITVQTGSKRLFRLICMLAALSAIFVAVVPGMCWARYFVGLFFWIGAAMVILCTRMSRSVSQSAMCGILLGAMVTLCVLNMSPSIGRNWKEIQNYKAIRQELSRLKELSEVGELQVSFAGDTTFYGRFFNLMDEGITEFRFQEEEAPDAMPIFPSRQLLYSVSGPEHLAEYIRRLDTDRYLIFIAAKDEASAAITGALAEAMQTLGLEFDMQDAYRCSYLAISDGSAIYEEKKEAEISCSMDVGGVSVFMRSGGYLEGDVASIMLDGVEYAKNRRGLNLVVYNKEKQYVVDSIYVDLFTDDKVCR